LYHIYIGKLFYFTFWNVPGNNNILKSNTILAGEEEEEHGSEEVPGGAHGAGYHQRWAEGDRDEGRRRVLLGIVLQVEDTSRYTVEEEQEQAEVAACRIELEVKRRSSERGVVGELWLHRQADLIHLWEQVAEEQAHRESYRSYHEPGRSVAVLADLLGRVVVVG
jgi:hypothetical protein